MNNIMENRLDPSLLTQSDRKSLDRLSDLVSRNDRPALIGRDGVRIELPDQVYHHLVRIIRDMRAGKAILLFPDNETMTTQAAANFLGVSRPFLIGLLEGGKIMHHRVGAHRRVYLKDLYNYCQKRDEDRKRILDSLAEEVESSGLYESAGKPDEG